MLVFKEFKTIYSRMLALIRAALRRFCGGFHKACWVVSFICVLPVLTLSSLHASVIAAWNQDFSYRIGSVVVYEAARFRAIKITRGNQPDQSPEFWLNLGDYAGTTYKPQLSFPSGPDRATDGIVSGGTPGADAVAEQVEQSNLATGDAYQAPSPSAEPAHPLLMRVLPQTTAKPVGDEWDPEAKYAGAGTIVSHVGRRWVNSAFTQGEEPGVSVVWVAIHANTADIDTPWDATKVYDRAGYQVVYKANRYQNSDWSLGEAPDAFDVWQLIDASGNVIENIGEWRADRFYSATNTQVSHAGRIWLNRVAAAGEVPGESAAWKLLRSNTTEPLTWHPLVIFDQKRTQVTWNSISWENKGWSQGDEPGLSPVWQDISTGSTHDVAPWNALKVYGAVGTVVRHKNKTYANQWWTKGEEPGGAGVWKLVRN